MFSKWKWRSQRPDENPQQPPAEPAAAPAPAPVSGSAPQAQAPAPEPERPRHVAPETAVEPAEDPTRIPVPPRRGVPNGFGRLPIHNVSPVVENGAYPAKAVEDETITVRANIFREGHDALGACVILTDPTGAEQRVDMAQVEPMGLDIWTARVPLGAPGDYSFRIEAFDDRWRTWRHNAAIKVAAGIDIPLVCAEGRLMLDEAAEAARTQGAEDDAAVLSDAARRLDPRAPARQLGEVASDTAVGVGMGRWLPRRLLTPTDEFPLVVHRRGAQFSSWYEFFPRSVGAVRHGDGSWTSGTLRSSERMLERIAALGFTVAYLPPISPIGHAYRKGPNNSLAAGPNDPGSPWAIGSAAGGHDAVNPELGTIEDFDHFVARAHELGLEVALDFALQASPDHPWVVEHPEWFTTRADGTIAYAENPPKKYQDIYPINFDNDPEGIYNEALRLAEFWIGHGVTILRVDNPHTKPVDFWAWFAHHLHERHPEVILQAEAFTRPEMMHALAKVGFHLSYCYYPWRNTKDELGQYLTELSTESVDFFRPNFFTNTPDINPLFTRSGNPAAFAIRMILAATMSPAWGVYSGFELCEHEPLRAGGEEYLNSEKYEFRPRDYDAEPNLNGLLAKLNSIRAAHPALQQMRGTKVLETSSDKVFAFAKRDGWDRVVTVVSLDPDEGVDAEVRVDLGWLGLDPGRGIRVHDELTGQDFDWGAVDYVRLWPAQPAHVLSVSPVQL
ncbi:alpha-1,4-glucan--maltose-1-phosphate maltosyltransferase [Propionibacterium acidifaciens]|uniref:alpha-1,4-glucan--maltose-1-phosphate maltosyltransferase n=1 Tax=Propionibacterium acidifaciens TaxID=556499 RepID=UPI003C6DFEDA